MANIIKIKRGQATDIGTADLEEGELAVAYDEGKTKADLYVGNGTSKVQINLKGETGERGPTGEAGPQGAEGPEGAKGADGVTPKLTMGTVTTLEAGKNATASMSGSGDTYTLTLGIPKGADGEDGAAGSNGKDGAAATITVGTVKTGEAGSSATVTNSGTTSAAKLNFTIPRGKDGTNGTNGAKGDAGPNEVSTSTATAINGVLKGNGSKVAVATAGTDYLAPSSVIDGGTF